jgi:hypothetical protein
MTYAVDYSRGGFVRPETLIAVGRPAVLRYAVGDLSPNGRGITAAEYAAFKVGGIPVALYYEGQAEWMLGGYNAGGDAATVFANAVALAGMPARMPMHAAHDIDPDPAHFSLIDACLNGAKDVLGSWDRVGAYGGWLLIDYLAGGGAVKRLIQTSAWEYGRGIHPAATAYQYGYNAFYDNVNCDLVETLKDDWGQDTLYLTPPTPLPVPTPTYPAIVLPDWYARAQARDVPSQARDAAGNLWAPQRFRTQALGDAVPHTDAPAAGPHIPKGAKIDVNWAFENGADKNRLWFVNAQGYWAATTFNTVIELPHARKAKKAA